MKQKAIQLRLETLILKDKQMIWGYKSALTRTKSKWKEMSYTGQIKKLENSIDKIKEALQYLEMYPTGDFNMVKLCSRFGFRGYKQER